MSIYSASVKRPVTTILIFVGLMVMGIYSLTQLPVDLYPEMELPFVVVYTTYPGASASDIETNVTRPLENSLNSVSNLKEITSTSSDANSVVFMNFEYGTNLDEASNDIRSALSFIERYLPEDCEKPTIIKFSTSMMPIIFYAITAKESYAGLEKVLDEKIVNPLNRIEGVGSVSLAGVPGRKVYIDVDPRKMEAYNLSIEQIGNVIRAENMNMPAGYIEMGKTDYPLRIQGEFPESDVVKNLVVSNFNGNSVYLKDIAEVRDTIRESKLDTKINGAKGMSMYVMKQSGGNTVKVTRDIEKALTTLKKDLPQDVKIEKLFDSASFIKGSISNLTETLMYAAIFVVLVVLFFLGRWRATFIVILTIPISLIVAFIYLFITGASINIISLTSLSIAIGMVVDDAIVVLENITKHIERGSKPKDAAIYATNEVAVAVIASTLTIISVFFPLTMVSGLAGIMFKQLGWIVTIIISVSALAALTLTPMLSSVMLKENPKRTKAFQYLYAPIERMLDGLDNLYEKGLRKAIHHRFIVMTAALLLFLSSLFLVAKVGTDFFPASDNSQIGVSVELPVGTRVEQARKLNTYLYEMWKKKYPEIEILQTSMGQSDGSNIFLSLRSSGSHIITYTAKLSKPKQRKRDMFEISDEIRKDLAGIPEIYRYNVSPGGSNMGMGSGGTVLEMD